MNKEPLSFLQQIIAKQRERIQQIKNHQKTNRKPVKNNEHLVIFNAKEYPFKDEYQKGNNTYKTIINSQTVEDILEKLILLAHPNIIQIQKIAKSKPATHSTYKTTTFYSLYYQVVTYSLKRRMKNSKPQRKMPPLPNSNDLCQKLVEVAEYMMGVDLYYLINLENIGLTQDGQIKVYASPLVIADPRSQNITKGDVMGSIDKVMTWWNSALSFQQTFKQAGEQGNLTGSLSFTPSELREKQKISSSLIEPSNPKRKEPIPQKIKNIEEEIKHIRQNFNDKMKDRQRKRSDNSLFQLQDSTKQYAKILQSTNLRQKFDEKNQQQSIQQNIHCINIYNHPPQQKNQPRKTKNIQTKPLYSFTIENDYPHPPENMVRFKSQPADFYPDDDLRHEQEDQNLSVDTYEMDMGLEFEAPIVVNNEFRSSLCMPKKENSQRNYNPDKNQTNMSPRKSQKKGANQVVANKNFTQSAGPLQFKNFVVQFIKPQFLAKRSNIYEEPGEDDSQKSHSDSGKPPVYYRQITDAGKSVASYNQNSVSLKKSQNHSSQASGQKIKAKGNDKKYKSRSPEKKGKLQPIYPGANFHQKYSEEKPRNIKNDLIRKSTLQERKINSKVQEALQKTRNAIAILKKVKSKQVE